MKNVNDLYSYENNLLEKGYKYICGTDEAGRGPLFGPVYASAVILDPLNKIEGLNDSKKLTPKKREELYNEIKEKALAYSIVSIDNNEIDRINILEASRKAMEEAILSLKIKPDYILTDYMKLYHINDIEYLPLAHGDALSATIGAASILAKVERDRYIDSISNQYKEYNLSKNKGYGTKDHLEALDKYGVTPLHRKSYKPVKDRLTKQLSLDI